MPDKFFDERVKLRYKVLSNNAISWINTLYDHTENEVKLSYNPTLVYLVAQSALIDIDRYKEHHLSNESGSGEPGSTQPIDKLSDEVKRAAYFLKWIRKLQPIHLDEDPRVSSTNINEKSMRYATLSNIGFGISFALNSLSDSPNAPQIIRPSVTFYEELLYILTYRELQGDALLIIMHMLRNLSTGIPLLRE